MISLIIIMIVNCIYIYICVYAHVCIYVYMHIYIYIYVCVHAVGAVGNGKHRRKTETPLYTHSACHSVFLLISACTNIHTNTYCILH